MKFDLIRTDSESKARAAVITTDNGEIETPIFMPVGTLGTVKGVHQRELETDIGAQIILGNTYHLYLRPGGDMMQEYGGLHKFMNWNRPILTDSGGYQVYSLSNQRKIHEKGVEFRSHIDGSRHFFTPENVMDMQRQIGADIIMAFDECTPYPCSKDYVARSMDMTHRWLKRCVDHHAISEPLYGHSQALFPIVQGGVYPDMRKQSAETIASHNMPGNAIGGLSVGEPAEEMYAMTDLVCQILPEQKPRYLMGVGTPANILENIGLGIDMFDCVLPTRNARHGLIYTWDGIINIKNRKWETDQSPLDSKGTTFVDSTYTKAYVRHLFACKELLGPQITSIHNLGFYLDLVKTARIKILDGTFRQWKDTMVVKLQERL